MEELHGYTISVSSDLDRFHRGLNKPKEEDIDTRKEPNHLRGKG